MESAILVAKGLSHSHRFTVGPGEEEGAVEGQTDRRTGLKSD